MIDLKWLEGYSGQSAEELIALEGEYRADSLVLAFEAAIRAKAARVGEAYPTDEERVVLAVEALEREVNNGGYGQFFLNTPEFAPTIVDALNRTGCTAVAMLTEEAIAALALPGPVTTEAVNQAMDEDNEERDDKLDDCDTQYYAVAGDLAGALLQYIKVNRSRIEL
ncbi:MAG: DMP19 family protein [Armatimonadota bacterium]